MRGLTVGFYMQALITGLNTVDVQPAGAVVDPTQTLTAIQKKEAEDLYELVRFRMGRNPPTLTSSPNPDMRVRNEALGPNMHILFAHSSSHAEWVFYAPCIICATYTLPTCGAFIAMRHRSCSQCLNNSYMQHVHFCAQHDCLLMLCTSMPSMQGADECAVSSKIPSYLCLYTSTLPATFFYT
jgi:hypothetical protein